MTDLDKALSLQPTDWKESRVAMERYAAHMKARRDAILKLAAVKGSVSINDGIATLEDGSTINLTVLGKRVSC